MFGIFDLSLQRMGSVERFYAVIRIMEGGHFSRPTVCSISHLKQYVEMKSQAIKVNVTCHVNFLSSVVSGAV